MVKACTQAPPLECSAGVVACDRLDSWAELRDMLSSIQVMLYQQGLEQQGVYLECTSVRR